MTLEMLRQTERLPHDGINRELIITREEILKREKELAAQISEDYKGKSPVLIGILNGATFFLADLMRELDPDLLAEMDTLKVSSYGKEMESSRQPEITDNLKIEIKDRHVIVVEDIVDKGYSMQTIIDKLSEKEPASLAICTLTSKRESREVEVPVNYVGFNIENKWVEGSGMDSGEKNRGLGGIYVVNNTT